MREIVLTQNQVALVDDEDYEWLNQWKWYADKPKTGDTFYAYRNSSTVNGKRHRIAMHHEVAGYPLKSFEIDHESGRGLDNQRSNLRHVTKRENQQNRKNGKKKSSQYPGVYWNKARRKWQVNISINNKTKYLGNFVNEKEAYETYCQAVSELGEKVLGANI